jgi:hypothetical protein
MDRKTASTAQIATASHTDLTWHVYRPGTGELVGGEPCSRCSAPAVVFIKGDAFCSHCAVQTLPDESGAEGNRERTRR